jgi:hypothetical protein
LAIEAFTVLPTAGPLHLGLALVEAQELFQRLSGFDLFLDISSPVSAIFPSLIIKFRLAGFVPDGLFIAVPFVTLYGRSASAEVVAVIETTPCSTKPIHPITEMALPEPMQRFRRWWRKFKVWSHSRLVYE